MSSHNENAHATPPGTPPDDAVDSLAARARALRNASVRDLVPPRLARKNVGLLCDDPARPEALAIHRAAIGLGAQVSLVRPRFDAEDAATTASTARVLGRLYDAVVCVGLAPGLVGALRRHAGIPILDEESIAHEPGDPAAPVVDVDAADAEGRLFLWQAALVGSLA